jgi:hypothetical protein
MAGASGAPIEFGVLFKGKRVAILRRDRERGRAFVRCDIDRRSVPAEEAGLPRQSPVRHLNGKARQIHYCDFVGRSFLVAESIGSS